MPLLSALPLALGLVGPSLVWGHCSAGDFYSGLDWGLESAELRSALHLRLRAPHTVVPPSLGVRKAVEVLDADQQQPGQVILFDTQESVASSTAWGPGHLWPRAKGVGSEGLDSVDLHCLRATGWNFSSALWTEQPCERDGDAGCPPAPVRGDLARCLMYMALRYDGTEVDTERLRLTDCPGSKTGAAGRRSRLIEWHLADPVDAAEQARNDRVCREYQGNRNPFVDRPAIAQRLFPREPPCREGSPLAARRLQVAATTGVVAATTVAPVVAATTAGAVVTTVAPAATTVGSAVTAVGTTAAPVTVAGTTAAPVTAAGTTAAAVVGTTGAATNVTTVLVTGLSTTATTSKTATNTASSSTSTVTTTRTSTTSTRTTDTTSTVTNTSTTTATTTKTTVTTTTTTFTTTTNSSTTTSTATTTKSTTTSSTLTASTSTASTSTASTSSATTMTSSTSSMTTTTPTTTTPTTTTPTTTTPTTTTPTTTTKTTSSSSTTTKTTMTSTKTTTSTVTTMTRTTVTTTRTETTMTRTRTITRSRYFAEMEVDLSSAQGRGGLPVLFCLLSALLAATASAAAPH